jgi:hypothetical protein
MNYKPTFIESAHSTTQKGHDVDNLIIISYRFNNGGSHNFIYKLGFLPNLKVVASCQEQTIYNTNSKIGF